MNTVQHDKDLRGSLKHKIGYGVLVVGALILLTVCVGKVAEVKEDAYTKKVLETEMAYRQCNHELALQPIPYAEIDESCSKAFDGFYALSNINNAGDTFSLWVAKHPLLRTKLNLSVWQKVTVEFAELYQADPTKFPKTKKVFDDENFD